MEYEMRNLQAEDIFSIVKILNGIGLKNIKESIDFEEINNIRKRMVKDNSEDNSEDIYSQVGVNVVMSIATVILENLPKIKNDLYTFVGETLDNKNIIVILPNALCTSGLSIEGKSGEESVGKFTFECHGDANESLTTLPYKIYYPTASV